MNRQMKISNFIYYIDLCLVPDFSSNIHNNTNITIQGVKKLRLQRFRDDRGD